MSADLTRGEMGSLDWSPDKRASSLEAVFNHVIKLADDADGYYRSKRPSKRAWGRRLRFLAILLGAVAAVLPVIVQITTTNGKPAIAPGWSAVALAVAAVGAASC